MENITLNLLQTIRIHFNQLCTAMIGFIALLDSYFLFVSSVEGTY